MVHAPDFAIVNTGNLPQSVVHGLVDRVSNRIPTLRLEMAHLTDLTYPPWVQFVFAPEVWQQCADLGEWLGEALLDLQRAHRPLMDIRLQMIWSDDVYVGVHAELSGDDPFAQQFKQYVRAMPHIQKDMAQLESTGLLPAVDVVCRFRDGQPVYRWFNTERIETVEWSAQDAASGIVSVPETTRRSVLVIDDDVVIHDMVGFCLGDMVDVSFASNIAEGVAALQVFRPDLILLDQCMPDQDGLSWLQGRGDAATDIPIVFITAEQREEVLAAALAAGAVDYIRKPFSRLELRARVQSAMGRVPGDTGARKIQKLLVLDDDRAALDLIEAQLGDVIEHIDLIDDPFDALALADSVRPDAVIVDLAMPKMDGLEWLRRFRQLPQRQDVPVIFLTADQLPRHAAEALDLGAVDYLRKPISPLELQARLAAAMSTTWR